MIIVPVSSAESSLPPPAPSVKPGANTTVTANALGFAVSVPNRGVTWDHPFRPALSGRRITLRIGTVHSEAGDGPLEPQIQSGGDWLPMSGKNGISPTPLDLRDAKPNADGVSWIVLDVFPDEKGELRKNDLPHIYHSADNPVSTGKMIGETALCMLVWLGKSPVRAIPIVTFNLIYERFLPSLGNPTGPTKHIFR